jgi:hypothetical protein
MSGRSACHCLKIASTLSLADRRSVAVAQAEARGRRAFICAELFAGFDFTISTISMVLAQEARCFDHYALLEKGLVRRF